MAAGQGFKTFTTGEVLTAADVNGYLMQGVLVFASAAARNAAITSPQEGQFAFTKDTNGLWYYDGAAWVASGATGDIEGVTAGVGITGGGTSGTVTITNDMATTITASGDIVVGTGNGTYDNLPIGTTGQVLTADTTVSPYKVKWATASAGSVSSYTPTWTNLTVGNGTQAFSYIQIGKFVQVRGYLTFGSTTSISSSPEITLPVASVDYLFQTLVGDLFILDAGTAGIWGKVTWEGTNKVSLNAYKAYTSASGLATQSNAGMSSTIPMTWTTGDAIRVQFSYEAA
jgi:hypothetical protein